MNNQTMIISIVAVLAVLGLGYALMRPATDTTTTQPQTTAQAQAEPTQDTTTDTGAGSIVAIASGNPDFSTLVTAVTEAGLIDTLSGEGPFTVFAPTNAAFAKLPAGTLESLLQDKAALTKVLTYHVVANSVPAAEVVKLNSAQTVQGQTVTIQVVEGEVMINDSKVVATDIMADNGIIHVIDTVLLPE
jgi:uncharacterized surface protein with fasciclin (FAS1) repeats